LFVGHCRSVTLLRSTFRACVVGGAPCEAVGVDEIAFALVTFENCSSANGSGGACFVHCRNASVADSSFRFCSGGALSFSNCLQVALIRVDIRGGSADSGGAMSVFAENATAVTVADSVFQDNSALSAGGAIAVESPGNVTATNCSFISNRQTGETGGGGAIALLAADSLLSVRACCFAGNNATGAGAHIFGVQGAVVVLSGHSCFDGLPAHAVNASVVGFKGNAKFNCQSCVEGPTEQFTPPLFGAHRHSLIGVQILILTHYFPEFEHEP
jgi:hypothetical protein